MAVVKAKTSLFSTLREANKLATEGGVKVQTLLEHSLQNIRAKDHLNAFVSV
jgi:hypothetical protein